MSKIPKTLGKTMNNKGWLVLDSKIRVNAAFSTVFSSVPAKSQGSKNKIKNTSSTLCLIHIKRYTCSLSSLLRWPLDPPGEGHSSRDHNVTPLPFSIFLMFKISSANERKRGISFKWMECAWLCLHSCLSGAELQEQGG